MVNPGCFAFRFLGRTRVTLYSSGLSFADSGFRGHCLRFQRLVVRVFMTVVRVVALAEWPSVAERKLAR